MEFPAERNRDEAMRRQDGHRKAAAGPKQNRWAADEQLPESANKRPPEPLHEFPFAQVEVTA